MYYQGIHLLAPSIIKCGTKSSKRLLCPIFATFYSHLHNPTPHFLKCLSEGRELVGEDSYGVTHGLAVANSTLSELQILALIASLSLFDVKKIGLALQGQGFRKN
jgi:hypothetical protein